MKLSKNAWHVQFEDLVFEAADYFLKYKNRDIYAILKRMIDCLLAVAPYSSDGDYARQLQIMEENLTIEHIDGYQLISIGNTPA